MTVFGCGVCWQCVDGECGAWRCLVVVCVGSVYNGVRGVSGGDERLWFELWVTPFATPSVKPLVWSLNIYRGMKKNPRRLTPVLRTM